jgi:pilus assembly protein CpaE
MFEQFFARHAGGIHLLAAPRDYAEIPRITSPAVRRTLLLARANFPYVVVDLDNAFSAEQVEALWQSDVILLVLRLDYTSIRNVRRTLDKLADLKIASEQIRLVANGYGEARQLGYRQAEEALGLKISHYIPNDPGRVNAAVNRGVPVVLHRPSAKVSRSLKDLATSVNGAYHGP